MDTSTWNVNRWLQHLEAIHPADIDMGLERVQQVAARLDCLKPAPLVILVGGTNGKGTTSALLTRLLARQGMRVGTYNSPHILKYNERVSVNGSDIADADLCHSFELVEQARGDIPLTYFEFGTLAALAWFRSQSLDACVLEIGLGGRLDAVNVVEADLSVVTSIGLDHEAWLGNDVNVIAYEKCSIAREGRYLVCGQPDAPARGRETVEQLHGFWLGRGEQFDVVEQANGDERVLKIRFLPYPDEDTRMEWQLPAGYIPGANIATAIQALAAIGHLLPEPEVAEVIRQLRVPGRLQGWQCQLEDGRTIRFTLDVAHNEQAASYLATRALQPDGILLGMLSDKPVEDVIMALPQPKQWLLAGLDGYRGLPVAGLQQRFAESDRGKEPVAAATVDVNSALQHILQTAKDGEHWLVVGSFVTVEYALKFIQAQQQAKENSWKSI
ncbi:bifunctional folylpolyglutamate synthase/dihydrofolate synthase [Oceanobacter mangrovi]|uniref:bifunctional folylpolyglutamate synthase/dihydrofolate synthase n=1 Tax=Oceanobacter mangrovi TaxID=2862510 RepID=UPI001C8DECEF|nr:folylpolyglutamate synthase/dihydrofolate synthase family protein [Oceanobacter mangrovi]